MADIRQGVAVSEAPRAHVVNPNEIDETKGIIYVRKGDASSDDELGQGVHAGLKTTQDGKTVLLPQPSDSPDDPLNWT
jgi:hypothetical protein